ncbi:VOC family protein [Streptomyces lincolnensis]|uniref:VOC family protein n=1 Tax=Streptomyces lincolnensis TaxID=1915 RepID=UPI001E4D2955|nr:VOC family protein [Streptomyces lincolnensis]MCD7445172.1 VOC family protein [Streptomyces lincolnensis]
MNRPSGPEYDGSFTPWLGVRDLHKSISWYSEKLGLEVSFLAEEAGWCELGIGAEHVFVGLYRMDSPGGTGGATLTFGVRDLDRERARLERLGVSFDGPTTAIPGLVSIATFRDLDNNPVMFSQPLRAMRH